MATTNTSRMRTLAEFSLEMKPGIQAVKTPEVFKPIGVGLVRNLPKLFALIEDDGSEVVRHFRVMNVGDTLDISELPRYVGSFGGAQYFRPFHVLEVTPLPADDK